MKKLKYSPFIIASLIVLLSNCNSFEQRDKKKNEKKYSGYVPDESTAKKIAEAIWLPIYSSTVLNEKPFTVSMIGDSVWVVEGSLERGKSGGTAYIEIRMKDCLVLKVTHGK